MTHPSSADASGLEIADWDAAAALEGAGWRYPGSLSVYNPAEPLDPACSAAIRDADGRLVGFVVWGAEARVAGQQSDPGVVDVGLGMAPALVGRGLGAAFVSVAVAHARQVARHSGASRLRCAILSWNMASRTVARQAGFTQESTLVNERGTFVVLTALVDDLRP